MRSIYGDDESVHQVPYDHLLAETPKAWRVLIDGKPHWIPKSKAEIDTDARKLFMGDWMLREKELEMYVED
jgi:hypothetical protein